MQKCYFSVMQGKVGLLACIGNFICLVVMAHGAGTIAFIPNKGQWPGNFQYRASLPQTSLFVSSGALRVAMTPPNSHTRQRPTANLPHAFAWQIDWKGANLKAKPTHRREAEHAVHYHLGNAPTVTTNPVEELALPETYPGITLVYHSRGENAAFDFELKPGTDAGRIEFAITGTTAIITAKGDLEVETPYGPVVLTAPKAWQADGKPVAVSFTNRNNAYGFTLGRYDKRQGLTIDPSLVFSTYSGSRADNWGSTATYDSEGNMYTGGTVFDRGFPATLGALDTSYQSAVDIGILKYSSNGRRLLWATYLGGNGSESPSSLICGDDGSLYIMAATGSNNFPTTANAYDRTFGGGPSIDPMGYSFIDYWFPNGSDFAISRISADGRQLIGSTYLGGSANEGLLGQPDGLLTNLTANYGDQFRGEIVLDRLGRVCLAGTSNSLNFPTTAAMRPGQALGNGDAAVARLSPDLTRLLNAGLIGGNQPDACFGIATDTSGNCYVSGGTKSVNLRTTLGVVNPAFSGVVDGFVATIDSGWQQVNALTYLGTNLYDQAYLVQTDGRGNVYVLGQTASSYAVTPGVYSAGTTGQFIHCLTPDYRQTIFSTRVCPTAGFLSPTAFLVDDCGRIYASGWGGNTNGGRYMGGFTQGLPTTADAYKRVSDGSDFYLMVLEPGATSLAYATFMGADDPANGEHVDGGTSRFDKRGVVYQSVCGCGGSNFPTTPGAWSTANNAGNRCNNLGFKFDFSLLKADFVATPSLPQACVPFTLNLRNQSRFATRYQWQLSTGDTSTTSDSSLSFTITRPGPIRIVLRAFNPTTCVRVDSTVRTLIANEVQVEADTVLRLCQTGQALQLRNATQPGYQFRWVAGTGITDTTAPNQTLRNPIRFGAYPVQVRSPQGCVGTRTFSVRDGRFSISVSPRTIPTCVDSLVTLSVSGLNLIDSNLVWSPGPGIVLGRGATVQFATPSPGRHQIILSARNDSACVATLFDTAYVDVLNRPFIADTLILFCPGDQIALRPPLDTSIYVTWPGGQRGGTFMQTANQMGSFSVDLSNRGGCMARRVYNFDFELFQARANVSTAYNPCTNRYTLSYQNLTDAIDSREWQFNGTNLPAGDSGHFTTPPLPGEPQLELLIRRRGCQASLAYPVAFTGQPVGFIPDWDITPVYKTCTEIPQAKINAQNSTADSVWFEADNATVYGKVNTMMFAEAAQKTIRYVQTKGPCRLAQERTFSAVPLKMGNVLTLNNDGLNEKLITLPEANDWILNVADRWGRQKATGTVGNLNWPRANQEAGTYFYHLKNQDGLNCKGWVEVVK